MVWENNCQLVVMMTGLIERGKSKCARYWPPEGAEPDSYGPYQVSFVKSVLGKGFTTTFLKLSNGSESRPIIHIWYNTWPDHGVPRQDGVPYPDDLLGKSLVPVIVPVLTDFQG